MKHKWHDEIVAWAGGAEIEAINKDFWFTTDYPMWHSSDYPMWHSSDYKFRIKPQPKEWQGLSDHEILECLSKTEWNYIDYCPDHDVFASHIEAKLKEKNT